MTKVVMKAESKTVALDFDGVIHQYHGWNDGKMNEPMPKIEGLLKELKRRGAKAVIYSTRDSEPIKAWLTEHHLDQYLADVSSTKPPAQSYLDDRAMTFTPDMLDDPEALADQLLSFQSHYEKSAKQYGDRPVRLMAKWDESQHPRGEAGRFTDGGDGGEKKPEASGTRGGFHIPAGYEDDEPQGVGTKPERSPLPPGRYHDYMPGAYQQQGPTHKAETGQPDPGVMVALMMPAHVGQKLLDKFGGNGPGKIGEETPGGMNEGQATIPLHLEPVNQLHVTLAYLGRRSELPPDALGHIADTVHAAIGGHGPIVGRVGGVGKFFADASSDSRDVYHATIDAPTLPDFRQRIIHALDQAGMPARQDHGFVPHVTLAYSDPNNPAGTIKQPDFGGGIGGVLVFDKVSVVSGNQRIDVPLRTMRKFMDGLSDVGGGALIPEPSRPTPKPPKKTDRETQARGNRGDLPTIAAHEGRQPAPMPNPAFPTIELPRPGLAFGYGKSLTAEQETELIRHNAQEPEARTTHRFKSAQWTSGNGHPRCKVCGGEEPVGGMCRPDVKKTMLQEVADQPHRTHPGLLTRSGQRNCSVCGRFTPIKGLCMPHFSPGAHVPKPLVDPRVNAEGGQLDIDPRGSVPGAGIPLDIPASSTTDARGFVVNEDPAAAGATPPGIAQPREEQPGDNQLKPNLQPRFTSRVTPSPGPPSRKRKSRSKLLGSMIEPGLKVGDPTDREEVRAILERRAVTKTEDAPLDYRILSKADEQRYTLGVAYPANEVDAHKEFTSPEELEHSAWSAMARNMGIGIQHMDGTDGAGIVVESYIYRGPNWEMGDQVVKAGDWLLGVVWTPHAWQLIRSGMLTGYSIQGYAQTKRMAR